MEFTQLEKQLRDIHCSYQLKKMSNRANGVLKKKAQKNIQTLVLH